MLYKLYRILGDRLRITDLRGKPEAMFDPASNIEYRWKDNRWVPSPVQAESAEEFCRRYGKRLF